MGLKNFKEGAEFIANQASKKFEDIGNKINQVSNEIKDEFLNYHNKQQTINTELINVSDNHEERILQLEENRFFVKSSRRGLEDLEPIHQDRVIGWLQKLVVEYNSRDMQINANQQKFLSNIIQFMGANDSLIEVSDLSILENLGTSELHEIIYKIFLIFTYLYNNSFENLQDVEDISALFKLSTTNKMNIQSLLEQRIPLLGIDGLINLYNSSKPLNSFTIQSVYANVKEIHSHPLLNNNLTNEEKKLYIQGFVLIADGCLFSEEQYCYIKALVNITKCTSALEELEQLCNTPQKFSLKNWIALFKSDEIRYSWLLDACMILCLQPNILKEQVKINLLNEASKSISAFKLEKIVSHYLELCLSNDVNELYQSIRDIAPYTKGWEHILEYRGKILLDVFNTVKEKIYSTNEKISKLSLELTLYSCDINIDISTYVDMEDLADNFLEKLQLKTMRAYVSSGRKTAYEKLKEYQQKAELIIEDCYPLLRECNSILYTFSLDQISPKNKIQSYELDNSALNENWYDDYNHYLESITNTLDNFSNAFLLFIDQLTMIEQGNYHTSIESLIKSKKKESENKKNEELENKKSITIYSENEKYTVSLNWQNIENIPFELDEIQTITFFNDSWFLINSKLAWCLDKNLTWQKFENLPDEYLKNFYCVNNIFFIVTYRNLWYTLDFQKWQQIQIPDEDIINLFYFDNQYILITKKNIDYTYTEKGFIFDSEAQSFYDTTNVWTCKILDGNWSKWNEACFSNEGFTLQSNIACNDKLILACFGYDYLYKTRV